MSIIATFSLGLIVLFGLDHLLIFLMNPAVLTNSPSHEEAIDLVDQSAGRSIAIFALVLVVIQFTLEGTELTFYDNLALVTLIMSAGFLMISFVLELFADLRVLLFRFQLTSLRYSGLLLFLSLFFIVKSESLPDLLPNIFGAFVATSWLIWFIHEAHYIFSTQKDEWANQPMSRMEWISNRF